MATLPAPGAMLDVHVLGDNPLPALAAGARGSGSIHHPLAQPVSRHFRVPTSDRRGCGASVLDDQQDDDERLRSDADDVARLIALSLLPDAGRTHELAFLRDTYALYHAQGLRPAMGKFLMFWTGILNRSGGSTRPGSAASGHRSIHGYRSRVPTRGETGVGSRIGSVDTVHCATRTINASMNTRTLAARPLWLG